MFSYFQERFTKIVAFLMIVLSIVEYSKTLHFYRLRVNNPPPPYPSGLDWGNPTHTSILTSDCK